MKKMQADDHTTTSSGQETTGKKTGKKHQRVIMRVLVGVMMIVSCVSVSMLLFVIIYKNIPWTHPEFAVFFFLVINAVLAIGFIGRIIKNRMLYSILIIALFGANICLSLYGIFQGGFWINIGLLVFEEAIHGFGFGFSISLLAKDNNAWLSFYEIIRTSNTTDLTRVETPLGLCDLVRITKMLIRSHQLYGSLDSKTRIFTRVANPIVPVTIIKAKVNVPQRDNKKKQRNQDKGKAPSTPVAKSIAILEHELALDKTIAVKDVVRQLKVGLDEAKALLDALNEPTSYSEEDVAGLKALATTVLQQVAEPTLLDVLRMPGCSSVKAAKALGKYLLDEGIIERFPRHGGKTAISESRQPAILPEEKPSCVVCKGTIAGINYECPGCGARHHIGCAAALKASQGGCFACNRAIGQLPAIDEAAPSIIGIEEISRELDEILVVDEIMHKNITPLLDKVGQDLGRYVEASGMVVSLGDAVETTTAKLSKLVSATRAAVEQDRGAIMSEINELKAEMFRQFKEMREGNLDDNAIMEILRESKRNAKLLGRCVGRNIERMQARGLDEAAIQRDTERIFHVLGRLQALKEYTKQSPREMVVSMILGGITEALPGPAAKMVGHWLTDRFIERFF